MACLGYAVARTADGTPTSYLVHAADSDHLSVTRADADALRPMAPAGPVRRSEFAELHLHAQDTQASQLTAGTVRLDALSPAGPWKGW